MTIFHDGRTEPAYTKPLYGTHAQYTLSNGVSLPYFLTAMEIERAIDELKIHDEVSPSLDRKWSLSELFQREVDEDRVKDEMVKGYLADPHKLKFFNAITIVLMPKTADDHLLPKFPPADHDPGIPWNGTDAGDAAWRSADAKKANFGGVQYITVGSQGRLRWDPEKVHAVAVDGQHRLYSMRIFRDQARGRALTSVEKQTSVPVIFLLLDKAAGFAHTGGHATLRSVARELFTDLNKNAKEVDFAREIILDDLSVESRALRHLVTDETATDSSERLPLSMVRWQEAINRFDQGYYVNSLVHMYQLIDLVLDLKAPKDPVDRANVDAFIESLDDSLGMPDSTGSRKLRVGNRTLHDVFLEDYCDSDGEPETPFTRLPSTFVEVAIRGFEENHKPWLLKVLQEFKPYADILAYARQHNLIEGDFGNFWSQTKRHQALLKAEKQASNAEWFNEHMLKHIEAIESLKGKDETAQWAFKAIFQKAMVRLARRVAFENGGADPNLGTIDELLAFLTTLHDNGVLRVRARLPRNEVFDIWNFIATNLGGTKIKVAKATEDRILAILSLWYYAHRRIEVAKVTDPTKSFSAKELLSELQRGASTWPGSDEHCSTLIKAFDVQGLLGQRDVSDRIRKKKIMEHFANVLAAGVVHPLADDATEAAELEPSE
jgi:hypothetical protein